jgi:hypothetical protein
LVHTVRTDSDQGGAEVVGSGVGGGEGLVACLDFHGAVAAGGADEFLDAPTAVFSHPGGTGRGDPHRWRRTALLLLDKGNRTREIDSHDSF